MTKEILEITKKFHDTYERLSKDYNYETRKATKIFDITSNNGKLMYATVNEVVSPILKENQELKKQVEELSKNYNLDVRGIYIVDRNDEIMRLDKKALEYLRSLEQKNYRAKTQQKEFIKYLEDEREKQKEDIFENALTSKDIDLYIKRGKLLKIEEILQKYKSIIGASDEKES